MAEYDVVLLVEQVLSAQDAAQVRGLHEAIEEPVTYHVLVPVEDSATQIESGMGALAGGEVLATPTMFLDPEDADQIRREVLDEARAAVRDSVAALEKAGGKAVGDIVSVDPIQALAKKVADVDAREAIILTRPHVVTDAQAVDACLAMAHEHRVIVEPACGASLVPVLRGDPVLGDARTVVVVACGGVSAGFEQLLEWRDRLAA